MKNNWINLYQNSILDTYKIKENSLYVLKECFAAQYTVIKINETDVHMISRFGKEIIRNIRWCIKNLKHVMILG